MEIIRPPDLLCARCGHQFDDHVTSNCWWDHSGTDKHGDFEYRSCDCPEFVDPPEDETPAPDAAVMDTPVHRTSVTSEIDDMRSRIESALTQAEALSDLIHRTNDAHDPISKLNRVSSIISTLRGEQ